jgi:hypothetical protein
VNACLFVITDGLRNSGSVSDPNEVANAFRQLKLEEKCESILPILVGVNVGDENDCDPYLEQVRKGLAKFKNEAGFADYVALKDASPKTLGKLGNYMAKSASSQSNSLNKNEASKPLDINNI